MKKNIVSILIGDHPRIRGTNILWTSHHSPLLGSSPHTRDKLSANQLNASMSRIIPAYAGQIAAMAVDEALSAGSSPHTRDKCCAIIFHHVWLRIIPAYAGQITALEMSRGETRGSSPHTRDKSACIRFGNLTGGIIPAYAGQIRTSLLHMVQHQDHPRIRGTNRS